MCLSVKEFTVIRLCTEIYIDKNQLHKDLVTLLSSRTKRRGIYTDGTQGNQSYETCIFARSKYQSMSETVDESCISKALECF